MAPSTGPVLEAAPLGEAFDLAAAYDAGGSWFERDGVGAASGPPAIEADAAGVMRALRELAATASNDALPPVAIGSIGFAPDSIGHFGVGARTAARTHSSAWELRVVEPGGAAPDQGAFTRWSGAAPHDAFVPPQVRPVPDGHRYEAAVARAVDRIRDGALRKVVLARTVEVEAGRVLDPRSLGHRLRAVDPDAYTFALPTAGGGVLVGASPELLVSRRGLVVRSTPLAGSAPRSGDPAEDRALGARLEASAKNREEHAVVVEAVARTLRPLCDELTWDPSPALLPTANVWHLATRFRGMLREPAPDALSLARALHPTPAVGGEPAGAALELIAELEPFERGAYAGPVGWVDAGGDGEFAIALRCAELREDRAVCYAGAGIVAGSDPAGELDETERKFRAFLDALRWG